MINICHAHPGTGHVNYSWPVNCDWKCAIHREVTLSSNFFYVFKKKKKKDAQALGAVV